MIFTALTRSASSMTSGGAKRTLRRDISIRTLHTRTSEREQRREQAGVFCRRSTQRDRNTHTFPCVVFANTPLAFNSRQNCHAVLRLFPATSCSARGVACVFVDDDRVEEAEAAHGFDVGGLWAERRVSERSGRQGGAGEGGETASGGWEAGRERMRGA
jgi:hypothetical protein